MHTTADPALSIAHDTCTHVVHMYMSCIHRCVSTDGDGWVYNSVQSFVHRSYEVRLGIWKLGCDLSGGTQVARVRIELALPSHVP